MFNRRHVLRGSAAIGFGSLFMGGPSWSKDKAAIRTILPSVTDDTIAVKLLLDTPPPGVPSLTLDGRPVRARKMDADGYGWGFIQSGLKPGTRHEVAVKDEHGAALREPWALSTLPGPDSHPEQFCILFFTCAGGDEENASLPVAVRRALFDRALTFQPDLAIANGDHVYWDQWTGLKYVGSEAKHQRLAELYRRIAWLDEDQKFDSPHNRQALNTVVARQIASIYEDRFASVPLLFITDDHDYYENDNAGPWGYSFPPRPFTLNLWRNTANLAYPFALGRPKLPTYSAETVETVRIGKLIELALYDCRRGWSTAPGGGVLLPDVEAFLIDRLKRSDAAHYVHVPSNPFGWSKGALGEWYEDVPRGDTPQGNDKSYWRPGWFDQHQRIARALTEQKGRAAISISGDMHASAATRMTRSGDIDLSANPIEAILAGPIGTGKDGFPSTARGNLPFHPAKVEATDRNKFEERNGFTLFDVKPDRIEVRQFRWRPPEPVEAIASLQPFDTFTIPRPA